jgi:paraquat-inducible protein A
MQEVPDLLACEECDAVHRRSALGRNEVALCSCCGAELERDMSAYGRRALPLAIASFFMYVIANIFPIVEMELQGIVSRTTLIGSVFFLNSEGMPFVASLVLATTVLFPLLQLLALIYLLISVTRSGYHPAFNLLVRLLQTLRPWVMVEVFLLSAIVALVKLTSMATVVPGVALWAFGALTILLAAVSSFNPRYIWRITLLKQA